ncbi:hypothetical protein ACA910_011152 [Epithemia clementina (nom. ined.)]
MGMKPSPYHAIRHFHLAEEFACGPHLESGSPCRLDFIQLNLPGAADYDPRLPWVMKWDATVDSIAGDMATYVDDLRASGHSVENVWRVARRFASRLQYLGIQDAPRKRRPPSRSPGAWAGSVQNASLMGPYQKPPPKKNGKRQNESSNPMPRRSRTMWTAVLPFPLITRPCNATPGS